jgi:hypothetical protein
LSSQLYGFCLCDPVCICGKAMIWGRGTLNIVKLLRCKSVFLCVSLTLPWYHGVYVTPVLFDSLFFFSETVTNTDIAFDVFLCKAFLTMSHTFTRFCVFPFIFYFSLFHLGDKRTPLYLPCSIDNCLQNAENAVCLSACIYSKVPKTKTCLFVDI